MNLSHLKSRFTKTEVTKLAIITAVFFVALAASITMAQWNNPTATPPGNNALAPINVGSAEQTKRGALEVGYLRVSPASPGSVEGGEIALEANGFTNTHLDVNQGRFRVHTDGNDDFVVERDGRAQAPGGIQANQIGLGGVSGSGNCLHGPCTWPHETISMYSGHNLRINFDGTQRFVFENDGTLLAGAVRAGSFIYSSDERLKTKIQTAPGMDVVNQLRGVTFDWKKSEDNSYGLIAQEVEQVMPELVHEDEEGMKSVEYANIISVLIEGMKEQDQRITELELELKSKQ